MRSKAAGGAAEEAVGYYQNNRERMNCPHSQAVGLQMGLQVGLQVGSGPVESGCKEIVPQRLKGAGMRWRKAGTQAAAQLRCLLLGGAWRSFVSHWNQPAIAAAL